MKLFRKMKSESGAYTVMTAIMLTLMVACLALCVDFGFNYYRGAKLQNATDAAATAVAGNLGAIDSAYEDIAYQYLEKNGFPRYSKSDTEQENPLVYCTVEAKGETDYMTITDDYIKAGYYKLTVQAVDSTFFAKMLGFDTMFLTKTAYVKSDATYVAMPKALNYTVFAGSTKDVFLGNYKDSNKTIKQYEDALQINGKTGSVVNSLTALTGNVMNMFNNWVVKPVQSITFTGTWWNPFTWSFGYDTDNANSWQAKLYTSKLTTSGDVHSNSDIESQIQSINANRIKDRDFEHSTTANTISSFYNMEEIPDITPMYDDYGQVTFDAVGEIKVTVPKGKNWLGNGADNGALPTYYYLQNQQYIEETQATLRILDLIKPADYTRLNQPSTDADADGRTVWEYAADAYFRKYGGSITTELKEKIRSEATPTIAGNAASANLTYDSSTKEFSLQNQNSIVYSVSASMINNALNLAEQQGLNKLLMGVSLYDDSTYAGSIEAHGLDRLFKDTTPEGLTTVPYYAVNNKSNSKKTFGDGYDKLGDLSETVEFAKFNEDGTKTHVADVKITGNVIDREYQDIVNKAGTGSYKDNNNSDISVLDSTKIGVNYSIARTFVEHSEYIDMPNLKPYFIRQINKSVRNATKVREKISQSTAGQPTIRYAAKERTDTLRSYLGTACTECGTYYNGDTALQAGQSWVCSKCGTVNTALSYYDDTYKAENATALTFNKGNSYLFKEYKASKDSRVINLSSNEITLPAISKDGVGYTVKISNSSYKGYNLYNGTTLKTPLEFYNEEYQKKDTATPLAYDAIKDFYNKYKFNYKDYTNSSTGNQEQTNGFNAVSAKRTELSSQFSYSAKKALVKTAIENETKPTINNNGDGGQKNQVVFTKTTSASPSTQEKPLVSSVNSDNTYTVKFDNNSNQEKTIKVTNTHDIVDKVTSSTSYNLRTLLPSTDNLAYNYLNSSKTITASNFISAIYDSKGNSNWASVTFTSPFSDDKYVTCEWNGNKGNDKAFHRIWQSGEKKTSGGFIGIGAKEKKWEAADEFIKADNYSGQRGFIVRENSFLYYTNYLVTGGSQANESLGVRGCLLVGGSGYSNNNVNYSIYSVKDIQVGRVDNINASNENQLTQNGFLAATGNVKATNNFCVANKGFAIIDGNLTAESLKVFNGGTLIVRGNISVTNEIKNLGTIICIGTMSFGSDSTFTNTSITYAGSLSTTVNVSVTSQHKLYVANTISVNKISINNSYVHAGSTFSATYVGTTSDPAVSLSTSAILDAPNGFSAIGKSVDASSLLNISGSFNINGCSDLGEYVSDNTYSGVIKDADQTPIATAITFDNVHFKIGNNKSLTAPGSIKLKNSVVYITGNLSCTYLELENSKLYVDGDVTCSGANGSGNALQMTGTSIFLMRNGDSVGSNYKTLSCTGGKISVGDSNSKLYVNGTIKTKALNCNGNSKAYGYKAVQLTAAYAENSTGYFDIQGSSSDAFCGEDTSVTTNAGILASGSLYLPNKSIACPKLYVQSNGKVVVDGSEGTQTLSISSWVKVDSNGIFCNFGKTKLSGCWFTNEGMMYLLGGEDVTGCTNGAGKTDMTGDVQQSNPDYFRFMSGSTSFIGKNYSGSSTATLTYTSNYEAWGDVYFDCNVSITGKTQDYWTGGLWGLGSTEKGGKDMYNNEGLRVGHLGTAIYIPKGMTYINGNLVTYTDTSKDSGIHIGQYGSSSNDSNAGLVVNGDMSLATAVYNYGKLLVRGEFNLNSSNKVKCTEKNDKDSNAKEGKSFLNGRNEGSSPAVFYAGNLTVDSNLAITGTKNSNQTTKFWGYIQNYGEFYLNSKSVDVCGYAKGSNIDDKCNENFSDFAFFNYINSKAHFGGSVALNSNQLFNKWRSDANNETIFSCKGNLTYGGCVINCGTLYAGGNITNNESTSENGLKYLTKNFSLLNGFYVFDDKDKMRDHFVDNVHPESKLYCGGTIQVGTTEVDGKSGSIISCGDMYVKGNMYIYTNAAAYKPSGTSNIITNLLENPGSHAYYRTAFWMYDNANTFVGGEFFAGAGAAFGRDSIFMCGGDFRSKRSAKIGVKMGMSGQSFMNSYMTYWDNPSNDNYSTAYFYVGGNALINTIGSTVDSFVLLAKLQSILEAVGLNITEHVPHNNSRDLDIYANTNMYIGGSLYANSKVFMKENVDMVVAGNKTFYDNSGNLSNLIYVNRLASPQNFVPEKIANGLTVNNHLNANKNIKFYVYQDFDMSPSSSMIVNGAMQVNETTKIRDMTKSYVYGSYVCGKYVEIGKSLSGKDFSDIVNFDSGKEALSKDGSGNYMYLSEAEKAYISAHGETDFLSKYDFDKSAYMFVDGDFVSGQDLGTGALNIIDKIKKWLTNTFLSTGYTKVYASSALKVNGNLTSSRYITLRHDAKVFCKGDMDAATSIEGGVYSEWYVGGHMEAATSTTTQIIDAIGGLFNITSRGKIELQEQTRAVVGGNMFSSASIEIGELPDGAYTRGRKTTYAIAAPEGSNSFYDDSDYQESLILTYENGAYKDKGGASVYLDGSTYKYSDYKDEDNKNIEFGSKDKVIVYNTEDGKYHKKTYNGDVIDYTETGDGSTDDNPETRLPIVYKYNKVDLQAAQYFDPDGNELVTAAQDTHLIHDAYVRKDNGEFYCYKNECVERTIDSLATFDEKTYGAEIFCQGSMIAQNGFIKEHAYSISVVGDYVYAPDYITLRSNADLWVLPETFGNETYDFLPYPDMEEEHGNFLQRLWQNITYIIGRFAYNTTENFKFTTGSVYTFGNLTLNKNASLMGTNDLLQLGTITHADGTSNNAVEQFINDAMGFLTPRKVVLREDSLVLFGSNITISSSPISIDIDVLKGKESVAGFDSQGTATYPGYEFTCPDHSKNGPHKGYTYTKILDQAEYDDYVSNNKTLECDIPGCNRTMNLSKYKITQVSHPAVMYAGENLSISTTVDMQMTYLIADQGNVYFNNLYTKTAYNEQNLKELPNAISSFNGNIDYTAWVGQLSSLFYAPVGNIEFDGIYTDIYGSVIGNSVQMNAYYQNFHRFNNWRTMDLHIAEAGSVYIIPESTYRNAPELGDVFDLTSGAQYQDSPYGVRIFF